MSEGTYGDGIFEARPNYQALGKILGPKLTDVTFSKNVNLIIDVKQLFRKAFRKGSGYDDIQSINAAMAVQSISSEIINVVGHYRNFIFKEYGKYTTAYLLYSTSTCKRILKDVPTYKSEYYTKYIYGTEADSIRPGIVIRCAAAIKMVCDRVPHCYFIDTSNFDEYAVARYITSKSQPSDLDIILSNDEAMLTMIGPRVCVLSAKGQLSKLSDESSALENFLGSDYFGKSIGMSYHMIQTILAIAGDERCSLKPIPGVGLSGASKIVEKLISSESITDADHVDFPIKPEFLRGSSSVENKIISHINDMSKAYEIIGGRHIMLINEEPIAELLIGCSKKAPIDKRLYMDINSKAFPDFPVNFEMLMKGEQA